MDCRRWCRSQFMEPLVGEGGVSLHWREHPVGIGGDTPSARFRHRLGGGRISRQHRARRRELPIWSKRAYHADTAAAGVLTSLCHYGATKSASVQLDEVRARAKI